MDGKSVGFRPVNILEWLGKRVKIPPSATPQDGPRVVACVRRRLEVNATVHGLHIPLAPDGVHIRRNTSSKSAMVVNLML
jgi:hypothetical protein